MNVLSSSQPRREIAGLAICAAILLWQLFLPGFIGIANNRDFARVAGRLCIGRADVLSSYYVYFHPDYDRAQRYCWNSQLPTSEQGLADVASFFEKHLADPAHFDIRWLGAVHSILFLAGFWILLRALRPLNGAGFWIAAAAALWIFLDLSYVAYFNSFYTDAAAIDGALVMMAAALWIGTQPDRVAPALWFTLGAALFVSSKAQHGAMAPVLIAFLIAARPRPRALLAASSAAIAAGALWVILESPPWYQSQPRFNVVFSKILVLSPSPTKDVPELGLSPTDLPLIGQHAFLPYSPAFDPVWLDAFAHRCTYGKVALFFFRHPWRTLIVLRADLDREAWRRRPLEFSNFQPESGKPPGSLSDRFASWSSLNQLVWRAWPSGVVAWFAVVLIFGLSRKRWSGDTFGAAAVRAALLAVVLGVGEFLISSLVDARETDRHMLLFHLFADCTIFLALVYFLKPHPLKRT